MAASDVSALLDIASSGPTETSVPVTQEETPIESTTIEETPESVETAPEGIESGEAAAEGQEKPVDGRTNPAAIRTALKALRDSSPENAPIAKALNDAYGRYTAYKGVFPKVADAQNAKAILDAVGGNDGITSLQETIKAVNETDQLLYTGDGRVLKTVIEDMKAAGHPEAFGKLAPAFLDELRGHDEKAYYNALKPHFFQGLVDVNLPGVLSQLAKALNGETPDTATAKALIGEMTEWFNNLRDGVDKGAKADLDPERQAFEQERTKFQTERQKEFQNSVNKDYNSVNSVTLGTALKQYTKMPFAKNWTDGTKTSIARELMSTLLDELGADKTYKSQMDAFWSEKNPDKAKIINYHKSKVAIIGPRIVKQVMDNRYPGFRNTVAAPKPKPAAGGAVQARPAGRPTFLQAKPALEQMDMGRDPDRMLLSTGRAYLKGKKELYSWNPKDR